jgi:hypothetical protein
MDSPIVSAAANGILIEGNRNVVTGSYIGVAPSGLVQAANGLNGIHILNGDGNRIGGMRPGDRNVISANGLFGVLIQGSSNTITNNVVSDNLHSGVVVVGDSSSGNSIRRNAIYSNGGLGIDLGGDGVTQNDNGNPAAGIFPDQDAGPNGRQNFPELQNVQAGTQTQITGTLYSTPGASFLIDFYASTTSDPSGYGEGHRWLGSSIVTVEDYFASFDITLLAATFQGEYVTATATRLLSGGHESDTSEFSAALAIQGNVQATYIYYAASSFANSGIENALDNTKRLAKEGVEPVTLSYDNLINSSPGINGLVFDIRNLPGGSSGNLTAADFEFQMSPTGAFIEADHPPANWTVVPFPSSISVLPGSPDRVVIQWPNNAIANRWLRITVKATANTGLTEPEVYYIGHLLGETTGPSGGVYTVSFADITPIRSVVGQTVDASSIHDIDKNGTVSFADISAMRPNVGAQLTNITIPAANASSGGSGSEKLSSQQSGTGKSGGDSRRSSLLQMPALPGSPSLSTNTARPLPSWSDAPQTNPGPSDIKPVHRTGGIATRDQWLEELDVLLEDAPIVNYWSTERSEEDQEEWEELWISTISLSRKSPIDPPIQ